MEDHILDLPLLALGFPASCSCFTFSPLSCWFRAHSRLSLLDHSRMTRHSFCDMFSLFLLFLPLCCWLGSVLGSTCPQNEYTFACISALPWLACYPLCRRVWLMIRVCHISQQPSRPPACAHIKHPNASRNLEFHLLKQKHSPAFKPYTGL